MLLLQGFSRFYARDLSPITSRVFSSLRQDQAADNSGTARYEDKYVKYGTNEEKKAMSALKMAWTANRAKKVLFRRMMD